jgi:N-methylhydantoinase A/oxoprolinase/acetone carboxylase beta subunit
MFRFAIDRGGTFTDVYAELPNGASRVLKLLSVDPANYSDAPTEGIARVLEEFSGEKIDRSLPIDNEKIEWIRMGTTVATNALLERKVTLCSAVVFFFLTFVVVFFPCLFFTEICQLFLWFVLISRIKIF